MKICVICVRKKGYKQIVFNYINQINNDTSDYLFCTMDNIDKIDIDTVIFIICNYSRYSLGYEEPMKNQNNIMMFKQFIDKEFLDVINF